LMFAIPTETVTAEQAMEMRHSVTYSPQFLLENKGLLKQVQQWREQSPQPLYARGNQASAAAEFNVEAELGQVDFPTLILHGTGDLIVPPRNAELLAKKISTSKLVLIEGGPHLTFIEYYEKFNNAILTFIDDVEKGSFSPEPKRTVI
jgi:3-oxoadipate enol-lactonase